MAAMNIRKRRQNVSSSSSCSSIVSNENGIETGYVSDNSTCDADLTNPRPQNGGKVGFSDNTYPLLSECSVLKKEFILNVNGGKIFNDSDEGDFPTRKRQKCLTKNAVMARMNRIRKKQYLEDLEKKLEDVSKENAELKDQAKRNDDIVKKLNDELKYLKSILANSREINMLLKSVSHNTGLPVNSSVKKYADTEMINEIFDSDLREDPLLSYGDLESFSETDILGSELDVKLPVNIEGNSSSNLGICLHVAKHRVSLEFCSTCNNNACSSWLDG